MVDLPHLTGQIPYDVEQAILRLREALEGLQGEVSSARARLLTMPPGLTLPEIQAALAPTGAYALPTAGALNTLPAPVNPAPPPGTPVNDGIPNHLPEVQATYAAFPIGPASTDEELFRFCQRVAQAILAAGTDPPGLLCGLLLKASGSNIFTCNGVSYSLQRVCYPNGHVFDIIIGAGVGGTRTPQWADNFLTDPASYAAATDPTAPC